MTADPMPEATGSPANRSLTKEQISQLIHLRHALHRTPEVSGQERATAERIVAELKKAGADRIWQGIGGHGVAAEFRGATPDGPTLMFRCELDALPITEHSELPYRSLHPGIGHLCGHDGHMCMVMGVALTLSRHRPRTGRVILLFQPAEETGAGATAVVEDRKWHDIRPDMAFAFHNVPGRPLGEVGIRPGVANCASRGMRIKLYGRSSHAAAPEDGISPAQAMADLIRVLPRLGSGCISDPDYALSTLTHARLGEAAFGIAPGEAELFLTLRSSSDARMTQLVTEAKKHVAAIGQPLRVETTWHDIFHASVNDVAATEIAGLAARSLNAPVLDMTHPMPWSEDFGRYAGQDVRSSMLFLGAGIDHPQLHNPDYDFPDALLPMGAHLLVRIVDMVLDQ